MISFRSEIYLVASSIFHPVKYLYSRRARSRKREFFHGNADDCSTRGQNRQQQILWVFRELDPRPCACSRCRSIAREWISVTVGQTNTEGRWFPVVLYSFSLNRNAKLRALLFFYFCSGVERCVGTNHRGEQFGGGLGVRKIWPGCYVDPTCPFIFFFFFLSFFLFPALENRRPFRISVTANEIRRNENATSRQDQTPVRPALSSFAWRV